MENQRNFGALLEGNTPMNGMPTKERVELLPVDMIDPHPLNPRIVTPESLDEAFLESVERNGVLQPVFVKLFVDLFVKVEEYSPVILGGCPYSYGYFDRTIG